MQATEPIGTTSPMAPYDVFRPIRCLGMVDGRPCGRRGDTDIDWNVPGTHSLKCQRCKTQNLVRIVEAGR